MDITTHHEMELMLLDEIFEQWFDLEREVH
jgi:hypothetical protein